MQIVTQKTGFDIFHKLETICMNSQILFLEKNKKKLNISKCCLLKILLEC